MALKKLLKGVGRVAQAVAPIASVIPGPWMAAGMAVTALSAARRPGAPGAAPGAAPGLDFGQQWQQSILPGGAPAMAAPGGLAMALPAVFGGAAGRLASSLGIGAVARAGVGLIRTAAGKVRGVVLGSGRFINAKKGAALARRVGIDAAAVALGVSTVEVAEMVMASQERGRRGRGVSASDIRRTRRTIRTIERMHDQIVSACRPAMPRTFRRAAPAACPPVRVLKVK